MTPQDAEADIWHDLKAVNKPDWAGFRRDVVNILKRAVVVLICASVLATGMLAFFL
mgnify:CR=1 FL=1